MVTKGILLDKVPQGSRTVLRLTGPDTERFLQGLLSAQICDLPPGGTVPAALLTPKGQLVSEIVAFTTGPNTIDVVAPAEVADSVFQSLDRHIIMDDVTVRRLDDAVAFVWPALEADPRGAVRILDCRHPAPGSLVIGPSDQVRAQLRDLDPGSADAFTAHRVATASPAWGHELTAGRLPPELGFAYAVSYDKGCFMGQEPLARVHARGQFNRVMVSVQATGTPHERVSLRCAGRENAGEWTTWVEQDGSVVGLALVHRSVAEPGRRLSTPDGIALEVTSGPLGDDPGQGTQPTVKAARAQLGKGPG